MPVCFLLGAAFSGNSQARGEAKLRLSLSEVQPGSMSSEHYCMLVFADHHFHAEKTNRSAGKDWEGRVYEGNLSDAEWNTLDGILESEGFRKLNVSPGYVPLAVQSAHFLAISLRREKEFQNKPMQARSVRRSLQLLGNIPITITEDEISAFLERLRKPVFLLFLAGWDAPPHRRNSSRT